jgi:deoxyribose-phosphate aldolase
MSSYEYNPKNEPSLEAVRSENGIEKSPEILKLLLSLVDLTTLNTDDTSTRVQEMCGKLNEFHRYFPACPCVGAICVYPLLVPVVRDNLAAKDVSIASVSAGFPSSQTFSDIKELESRMAVESGASEIDIVISLGKFLENELAYVSSEIKRIKQAIGRAKLKVILETGLLPDPSAVYRASMVSMESGADFIKTSTGKLQPAATPDAVLVMCHAIKAFFEQSGRKVGIKPAGGISTADQAIGFASIVQGVLGAEWLDPKLFRIGASRLANQLLGEITTLETGEVQELTYF